MAAALNQKAFERKLQNMSSTQDSVQTVSLWMIHHKKHATDMVKMWLDQLRKVKSDRRLVLFYLANDVLQNSRKKGTELSHAFNKALREAAPWLGDPKIRSSVERVIKIWTERKVFDKDYLENFRSKLGSASSSSRKTKEKPPLKQKPDQVENKPKNEKRLPPADFKPSKLIDTLSALREFEAELTLKHSHLSSLRIDASDLEAVHQLKDRAGGAKFWEEHGEATAKMEEFCDTLKKEQEYRKKVTTVLEDGEAFYDAAYGEVKVIVKAYKSFGNQLNSLKKKLDHKVNKLAVQAAERAKTGCVSAPVESFLSSGLPDFGGTPSSTPPHSKEAQSSQTPGESKPADPTVDNTEVADMDIEEDSDSEAPSADEERSSKSSQEEVPTSLNSTPAPQSTPSPTPLTPAPVVGPAQAIPSPFVAPVVLATQPISTQLPMPSYINIPSPFPVLSQTFVPVIAGMAPPVVRLPAPGQSGVHPGQAVASAMLPLPGVQMPEQQKPLTPPPRLPTSLPQPVTATLASAGIANSSLLTSATSTTSAVSTPAAPVAADSGSAASKLYSPTQAGNASPGSVGSAPSPVGSPELNLDDDDDTPETTPAPMGDVSFDFPGNQSFMDVVQMVPRSVPISGASSTDLGSFSDGALGTSARSTPTNPNQSACPGSVQPRSAVDILAQLLSKGRQLQKHSDNSPVEEVATPVVEEPPKEPTQGRPLLSLIDSLFPKLSDSIKTLKEKEQVSHSPTPKSPLQSEAPTLAGNTSQTDAEAPKFKGPRPLHEGSPSQVGSVEGETVHSDHKAPVHKMSGDPPEKIHQEGPGAPFSGPHSNGPPTQEGTFPRGRPIPGEGRFFDEAGSPFPGLQSKRSLDMPLERPLNRQFSGPPQEGPFSQDGRGALFTGPQNVRASDFPPGRAPIRGPSLDGPFPQRRRVPGEGMFHDERGPSFQGPPSNGPSGMGLTSPTRNGPPFRQMPPFGPDGQQRGPHEDIPFDREGSFPRGPLREGPPFGRAAPEGVSPGGLLTMPERPSHPPHSNHDRYHPNSMGTPDGGPGQDGPPTEPPFPNPLREGPGNRRHSDDRGPPRGPDFAVMHHGAPMFQGPFPGPPGRGRFQGNFMPGSMPRRNSQSEQRELSRDPTGAPYGKNSEKLDYCEDDPSFWTSFEASENSPRNPAHLANKPDSRFRERTFHPDRNSAEHQRPRFMNANVRPRDMKRLLPPPPLPPGLRPKRPFC